MPFSFTISAEIPASKEKIYNAWLHSEEHAAITGAPATTGTKVGDSFTAHGDYISGKNLELVPYSKIVQSWRTTEFTDTEEDSVIDIRLREQGEYTLLTMVHSNLPPHGTRYEKGWQDHYFEHMKDYFTNKKSSMTTQKVADRFIVLAREGKIEDILRELFSSVAVSTEPNEQMGPKVVEGLPGILKKSEMFNSMVEAFHGARISDPVVSDKYFSVSWWIDTTMKGQGRMQMDEICVYKVENGKIISEQFFY
jgi:uncharacterized protein YndB with AHSA1/START domain